MLRNSSMPRIEERLRLLAALASGVIVLIAGLTFLGWALGARILIRLLPSVVVMNPLTALMFIFAGVALWLRIRFIGSVRARVWIVVLSGSVAIVGLLKLADYVFGFPFHIDRLLFETRLPLYARFRGSEMAPNTALCLLFLGLALICFRAQDLKRLCPAQALVLAAGLIVLLALVGYIYRVLVLNRLGMSKPMSLESALVCALLCLGFLAAQPRRGVMLTITNATSGGIMARRLLPMAILIPLLSGLLLLMGEKAGLYGEELAISIFAVANVLIFTTLIWWNAKLLFVADLERVRTERRLAAQHNATRVLAESSGLEVAVPRLLQAVCEALGWQIGALWTFDRQAALLRCAHLWHAAEVHQNEFVQESRACSLSPGDGLPGVVWRQAGPLWISDLARDSRVKRSASAAKAGLHSAFGLPIWSGHEMYGVLEFFSRTAEPRDPALLEMMGIVAAQIGLFIERTRAEEQLRETTANLQRSNAELQQFAHVASHDLFEPLRMITSYLQLLQQEYRGGLDARAHEFIGFALDGARRMDALIHDLLAYSRLDVRGHALEPVESEHALNAALANLKIAIEEAHATITRSPLPRVRADSLQLTQVFQNLIGNAIKFHGSEPPRIEVAAHRRNGEWLFLVRDNGIGIDPRFFETIFVIFQRLHTRAEYGGTGMGLAICKKIIERHGGRIWVESAPGKGSTFFFTLPVSDA